MLSIFSHTSSPFSLSPFLPLSSPPSLLPSLSPPPSLYPFSLSFFLIALNRFQSCFSYFAGI